MAFKVPIRSGADSTRVPSRSFGAGLAGRGDGLLACGASVESAAGGDAVALGVASGGGEAARAAPKSGTCAAEGEATIGRLTGAAAASSVDACFAGCAALADTEAKAGDSGILPSETRALSSVGDSSDPTVLAGAGCAVFARARELASDDKGAPERLAADYGLWVGGYVRVELTSMRAHAAAFLSDVEAKPDSGEAGVAHRVQGITHQFARPTPSTIDTS